MSQNTFPNARSKLFGEGENSVGVITTPAVAGLTGSLSDSETSIGDGGGRAVTYPPGGNLDDLSEIIQRTVPVNITQSLNKIVIHAFGIFGTDGSDRTVTFRVRETDLNGIILATLGPFSTGSSSPSNSGAIEWNLTEVVNNIGLGITQLVLTRQINAAFISYHAGSSALFLWVIDDSHTGFIQTVAVAGKNIIESDSHTTHEQGVLPG